MSKITESSRLDKCLITGAPVTKILDFGQHAYADTFVAEDQVNLSEPVFPLEVYLNAESGSVQLGYVSDAEDRYNLYSYSYTSSNSKTARDHWDEYAATVKSKFDTAGLVVEIGSNDGYLIGQFNEPGTTAIGIDPSTAMWKIAEDRGVKTVNSLFNIDSAIQLLHQYGPAKVIMANNVYNHANSPLDFTKGVAGLLDPAGVFVFEVPYWGWMVTNGKFPDMTYHEHPTYFTIKMAQNLLAAAGLTIADYDIVNYHGRSLRIVAQHGSQVSAKVAEAIEQETVDGLFSVDFYNELQLQLVQQRNEWLQKFYEIVANDPSAVIIGVGAAAKANTWLNWHGLNKTHLLCVTDSSEFKQGKYTPLSRIPIRGDEEFAQHAYEAWEKMPKKQVEHHDSNLRFSEPEQGATEIEKFFDIPHFSFQVQHVFPVQQFYRSQQQK
jgi:SAM-dependent methyltransferase